MEHPYSEIAEHNRRLIQDALNAARPGSTVNVDNLPLLRNADGRAPIAALGCVPRSSVLSEIENAAIEQQGQNSPAYS